MAKMKKALAALRYIVPSDMEYFLEEQAAEGWKLEHLGEMSLFYFSFEEGPGETAKFIVDVTALPKAVYLQTGIERGWEFMGKTGNCYVWRQVYKDKRPEDFTDKACRKKHCTRMGVGALLFALLCLGAAIALFYGAYIDVTMGESKHCIAYIVEGILQLPLVAYLSWAAHKLLGAVKR
ncbi:MAG: DUF2812 domain-containing protein [Lachnospiraceae bacterium]|nr:DUF2812 domain-containing protein [Lachnospiraceae bacterium]